MIGPLGVVGTVLVGVPTTGSAVVIAIAVSACGVVAVPSAINCGVAGVPPFATVVCATEVCFANSSIIAIGFSTDGNGETNSSGGIKVGVAAGAEDNDCVQAEIITIDITKIKMIGKPRFLLLIDSPLSFLSFNIQNAMLAHEL
jgi:hypothetical protein